MAKTKAGAAEPKLKLDPRNARKHGERNKSLIRQSLHEVGGLRSIGVDGNNIVRAGNGVFEQAKALGMTIRIVDAKPGELVAVRRKDLTGKKAVRAALLDNRAGELGSWDASILAAFAESDSKLLDGLFGPGELEDILSAEIAPDFKEFDESIADQVEMCKCPNCGHTFPK